MNDIGPGFDGVHPKVQHFHAVKISVYVQAKLDAVGQFVKFSRDLISAGF
jgi:hypothetical protein